MGGGTTQSAYRVTMSAGLSPRGRGNPYRTGGGVSRFRSIPAWAGEPRGRGGTDRLSQVYPRVGGGTVYVVCVVVDRVGLSPRGRGNRGQPVARLHGARQVYPRVGGGTRRCARRGRKDGVYPRVGGGTMRRPPMVLSQAGLSPRGRGNRDRPHVQPGRRGSILAWARDGATPGDHLHAVYPRVGGGTQSPAQVQVPCPELGLSPRGRGNLYSGNIAGPSLSGNPTGPVCQPSGFQFNGT